MRDGNQYAINQSFTLKLVTYAMMSSIKANEDAGKYIHPFISQWKPW